LHFFGFLKLYLILRSYILLPDIFYFEKSSRFSSCLVFFLAELLLFVSMLLCSFCAVKFRYLKSYQNWSYLVAFNLVACSMFLLLVLFCSTWKWVETEYETDPHFILAAHRPPNTEWWFRHCDPRNNAT